MVAKDNEILELILHGREERNLEYKSGENWRDIKFKIIKTILAMSNIRDGGTIVIGVSQSRDAFIPSGFSLTDLDSYSQDTIAANANEFSDPYTEVIVMKVPHEGKNFVVIQVEEFSELPVICKKDGDGLRKGAIYTRPRRMHETAEIPSQTEARELLDIATEKSIRSTYARIRRANLEVSEPEPSDGLFEKQRSSIFEVWEKNPLKRIHSTGWWEINIRPTRFEKERIPSLSKCREMIEACAVTLRGTDYPYMNREKIINGADWIECTDTSPEEEYWRLYQSGQFIHHIACEEDYLKDKITDRRLSIRSASPSGNYLAVISTLYRITEAFEFAARMASKGVLVPAVDISVKIVGTYNRQLFFWEPFRLLPFPYVSQLHEVEFKKEYPVTEIMANAAEFALDASLYFLERFNWTDPPRSIFSEDQKKFLERRV
jgi:hypothetical protein